MDHPTFEKSTRVLTRFRWESYDVKDSVEIVSIFESKGISNYELQDECTSETSSEYKDDRSTMRSCAVNKVWKNPEHSGEGMIEEDDMEQGDDHEITDTLQGQSNCQPDDIKVEDREVHG